MTLPIPEQVWLPLGLAVLAPLVLLAIVAPLTRRRARGIATVLTLQTAVVLSFGFAVLAAVATLSVARTGLQELRERHASGLRSLARELEATPLGLAGGNVPIALALYRAKYPSVSWVAVGTNRCRLDCVINGDGLVPLSASARAVVAGAWPRSDGSLLTRIDGRSVLVIEEPLRELATSGTSRSPSLAVAVRADALADQATRTAWIVLAIGYVLLLGVSGTSWRRLDRSLCSRIAAITRQVRAGRVSEENPALQIDAKELSDLGSAVTTYIQATVEQQRSSDERYRRLVELAPDGIFMCTPLGIKFANSAGLTLAGVRTRQELIGKPIEAFIEFESMRAREEPQTLRPATWTRANGAVLHVEVAEITDRSRGEETRQYMVRDVTERRSREAVLAHRAEHDSLTGLVNRARFEVRLTELLETQAQHASTDVHGPARQVAVLFIDLDGFKPVNDTHGHAAGDAVLVAVASRLRESTRGTDAIARLGGDEFAVLVDVRTPDEVTTVADRILQSLAQPILFDGKELVVGASIGVAQSDSTSLEVAGLPRRSEAAAAELLKAADAAMYAAKRKGGRRYDVTRGQSLPIEAAVSFRGVA